MFAPRMLPVVLLLSACNTPASRSANDTSAAEVKTAPVRAKAPADSPVTKPSISLTACPKAEALASVALTISPNAYDDAQDVQERLCSDVVAPLLTMADDYEGFQLIDEITTLVIDAPGTQPRYDGSAQRLRVPSAMMGARAALLAHLAQQGHVLRLKFAGVKTDVPITQLGDWRVCYTGTYDDATTDLDQIKSDCRGTQLLVACGARATGRLALAAIGERQAVLSDTGPSAYATETANGVDFYFHRGRSMGFAPAGTGVNNNGCDVGSTQAAQRLCWHLGNDRVKAGFRCGAQLGNSSADWQRYIFQAD